MFATFVMKKITILILTIGWRCASAQDFSFQKDHVEIYGHHIPVCMKDTQHNDCDTNYAVNKFEAIMGKGKHVVSHSKRSDRGGIKEKYIVEMEWYVYESKGITLRTDGYYHKKHDNTPVNQIEFNFFQTKDSVSIKQNIMIDSFHVDNTLSYEVIMNDSNWQPYISKASKVSSDDRGESIVFKNFGRWVTMGFRRVQGKFMISRMTVGMNETKN